MRIHFYRHIETSFNDLGIIAGQSLSSEITITDAGLQFFNTLTQHIDQASVDIIYCSDLDRALQSANILQARLGNDIPIKVTNDLRALNMGDFQGRPVLEFLNSEEVKECFSDYARKIPGGESINDLRARLLNFLNTLISTETHSKNIIVISHSASISNLKSVITGQPYEDITHCVIDYDGHSFRVASSARHELNKLKHNNYKG